MKRGIDYIGVGVGALIVSDQGELFFAQRGPKAKNERGLWEFPGGSVEFGETLVDALKREMREEYGIEIQVGVLLDLVDHILPEESQHWVSPTYICHIQSGQPRILEPEKCSQIGWFKPDHPPDPLTKITRENLKHYHAFMSLPALSQPDSGRFIHLESEDNGVMRGSRMGDDPGPNTQGG